MTSPIWMASPPEVHSALLSAGPGPGSLLAAAGAWTSLSTEYASAAAELSGLLAAAQAGAWQGPSAEQYVSAHLPYLAWLQQASIDSVGAAVQHEVAAAAYTSALAAMPTLPELATNHMIHGVLVATNFFGINTIPIALNEADYSRMWVQAATAMSTYQAASGGALASAPRTTAAPIILKAGPADPSDPPAPAAQSDPGSFLTQLLQALQNLYNQVVNFLQNVISALRQGIFGPLALLFANPVALLLFAAYEVISPIVTYGPMLLALALSLSLGFSTVTLPLAEMAPIAAPIAGGAPLVFASTGQSGLPAAGMSPTVASPAAPVSAAPAAAGAGAAPAPVPSTGGFGYVVGWGGDPETGFGPPVTGRGGAKAPAATIPAAAAAVPSRAEARARRRRRAAMRDYSDEFMDIDSGNGVVPDSGLPDNATASDSGAGALGFAGTARKETVAAAAGLTALAGDEFGGGPKMPMVPGTWDHDTKGRSEPDESGRGGQDG
jgi:PPE-repeat protein